MKEKTKQKNVKKQKEAKVVGGGLLLLSAHLHIFLLFFDNFFILPQSPFGCRWCFCHLPYGVPKEQQITKGILAFRQLWRLLILTLFYVF